MSRPCRSVRPGNETDELILRAHIGLLYLLLVNAVTFFVYGADKFQARRGAWRVRESTLHLLALVGGTPGALAGQLIFRHKTIDRRFRLVFTMIVVLQAILVVVVLAIR